MLLYMKWCSTASPQRQAFPLDEVVAYEYVAHLRAERAPATRAMSFKEAVGFAKGVQAAGRADDVSLSRPFRAAVACFTKKIARQAPPLKAEGVLFEELAG